MSTLSRDRLLECERLGWDSLCDHRGGHYYGEVMTPDAVMILVNGMILDRETIRATLDESPAWASYTIDDARLIDLGADAAALVYRARAERDPSEEPFTALMSSSYRLIDGEPRLALYQQTTITH